MADHGEVIANFMAITNADHSTASNILEAADWQLDAAIDLFFAAGQGAGLAPAPGVGHAAPMDDDEELARQLQRCGWVLNRPAAGGWIDGPRAERQRQHCHVCGCPTACTT